MPLLLGKEGWYMVKKFNYAKAYFVCCAIIILYVMMILNPKLLSLLGLNISENASIVILCIFSFITYFTYFKGFKDMVNSGFACFILFTIFITIAFGSLLLLTTLICSNLGALFYVALCLLLSVLYSKLCNSSNSNVTIFSNIFISIVINNLILLNSIIWKVFKLSQLESFFKIFRINLSGELIINLMLFPVLLMTSCGFCVNAKFDYDKWKNENKKKYRKKYRRKVNRLIKKSKH